MFESIDAYIQRCIRPTAEELDYYNSLLTYKKFKKKAFLLQEGEVCDFEAYIVKGCVRTFIVNDNGFEVTLSFGLEDWWVADIASFSEQKPSRMFIEAMEPTEVLMMSRANKELLLEKYPKFERMYRLMMQRSLPIVYERLLSTLNKPAQERYLEFLERYPQIAQRVAQHYIASYLGVSPEFLSKIRSRLGY